MLDMGIILVDSPGLSEYAHEEDNAIKHFSEMVEEFIPNAAATICIIDSNRGCVTKDTACMLRQLSKACAKKNVPKTQNPVLIILTKLDLVREQVRAKHLQMMRETVKGPAMMGIDSDQILQFNPKVALEAQRYKQEPPDFHTALPQIVKFIANAWRTKLQSLFLSCNRLLTNVLNQLAIRDMVFSQTWNGIVHETRALKCLEAAQRLQTSRKSIVEQLQTKATQLELTLIENLTQRLQAKKRRIVRAVRNNTDLSGENAKFASVDIMQDRVHVQFYNQFEPVLNECVMECSDEVTIAQTHLLHEAQKGYGEVFFEFTNIEQEFLCKTYLQKKHQRNSTTQKNAFFEFHLMTPFAIVGYAFNTLNALWKTFVRNRIVYEQIVANPDQWKTNFAEKLFDETILHVPRLLQTHLIYMQDMIESIDSYVSIQLTTFAKCCEMAKQSKQREEAQHEILQQVLAIGYELQKKFAQFQSQHLIKT